MATIDFEEFESILTKKKNVLETNIIMLSDELNIIAAEDEINDMEDMASLVSDNDHHKAQLQQQKSELAEVIHALGKIKKGTYGLCEKTGEQINIERLRAVPYARYSIEENK